MDRHAFFLLSGKSITPYLSKSNTNLFCFALKISCHYSPFLLEWPVKIECAGFVFLMDFS